MKKLKNKEPLNKDRSYLLKKVSIVIIVVIIIFASIYVIVGYFITLKVTTIFLVRHAEPNYATSSIDPELSSDGLVCANELAVILRNVTISAVYSTDTIRTKATAQPLASSNNLQIKLYTDHNSLVNEVKQKYNGKNVLIVGHQPNIPQIISAFGAKVYTVEDFEYYKIFIVAIPTFGQPWSVPLRYDNVTEAP